MAEYKPMEIRGFYRSHSHLPIWEVMDKAGIWEKVGLKVSFEFCNSSEVAEKALFGGEVDFVSGNHISPYLLVKRGKPIVCLTSPSNSVNDRLVTRSPVKKVSELEGKRIGDTTLVDSIGGYHHPRGNHMLYVLRAGLKLDEVEWVGRLARAPVGSAADDQRTDAHFNLDHVREERRIGGTIGQGADHGNTFRAHPAW